MSTTHTSGPLQVKDFVSEVDCERHILICSPGGCPLARMVGHAEELANAHVFAAAPELLEFALAAMDYLQHPDGHHLPPGAWFRLNEQVRTAIAKATAA